MSSASLSVPVGSRRRFRVGAALGCATNCTSSSSDSTVIVSVGAGAREELPTREEAVGGTGRLPRALCDRAGTAADADAGAGAGTDVGAGMGAGGGGGGLGRAYISVHWRAVLSCCARLRTNSIAMEGTVGGLDNWHVHGGRHLPSGSSVGGSAGAARGGEKRTRIWVGEEGGEGEDDLEKGERGGPVVLEDVDADVAAVGDVHVVDPAGHERDTGGRRKGRTAS